jgi:hypothetical protein
VWFGAEDGPARGTVRYIGLTNSKEKKSKIAVEFVCILFCRRLFNFAIYDFSFLQDEKVGEENYTGMTNGFGQFSIKSGYGRLLDPSEVMNEVDFGYEETVKKNEKTSENESATSSGEVNCEEPAVTIGTRVVWFKAKDDPVRGKVCFIGKVGGKKNTAEKFGVRLVLLTIFLTI